MYGPRPKPDGPTITATIHAALAEQVRAGRSIYSVAKASGVDAAVISRFASGKRGVNGVTLDRLAWSLGLGLTRVGTPAGEEAERGM